MAIRFVDKVTTVSTNNTRNLPDAAGIAYDRDDGRLKYNDAGTIRDVGALARPAVETVTAANTITAAESGRIFFLNSGTEFASTLPAPAAGLNYEFYVAAAPSGADYTITTTSSANIIVGHVVSSDLNAASDGDFEATGCDTISFVSAKAVLGDRVRVVSDGTNWYATAYCSVFDAITFTTAS